MAGDSIKVDLEKREVLRKGLSGLRQKGQVPAVIHDHGKQSMHVSGDYLKLVKIYSAAGKHHPVELNVGGKQHLAMIKDVDFEPTKRRMRHVVFQAIQQNEAVEAEVPIVFSEVDIPAEKVSLMVLKQLDHVLVKALPRDLPDELIVDPSTLAEVGDKLSVSDLKAPDGVTILTEPDMQIAVVEMPKDQIAEADAAAESLAEDAATRADEEETPAPATEESKSEESTEEV